MDFFQSVVAQDITESDGSKSYNLAIRPLSHLIINIKCLNLSANTKATAAQILGALEKIEVLRHGTSIVSLSALDLYAMNCILLGHEPIQVNATNLENSSRNIPLIVPFGRTLYNPNECLPGGTAGELQLKLEIDIADTGYDGYISQVEQVELPEATPARYLKYMTKDYTPSATGSAEVTIAREGTLAGILLWGTTIPTGTSWTTTIDQIRMLVNNQEKYYGTVNWESLHAMLVNRCNAAGGFSDHVHLENTGGSYAQNADTAAAEQGDHIISNHAYLDLSPGNVDDFLLETEPLSSLSLDVIAGDTNATRITPVILKDVSA
jgi:hypothetical protein|tara:strand:- start:7316 stop:8281 length:966 start_codon:yes stop_codon:yes gene_type:complete